MGATGDLAECLESADVFMGVSAPGIVDEDMLASTNDGPVLFGLANPGPEFDFDVARKRGGIGLLAAAADAIASLVDEPGPEAIVSDVFDERLVDRVAKAVVDHAHEV